MKSFTWIGVVTTLALLSLPPMAQPAYTQTLDDQRKWCNGTDQDLAIGGCTAVIQSGRETTSGLVEAFHNRGYAYYQKKDNTNAIKDFSEALKLDPAHIASYTWRGYAHRRTGSPAKAIQDFSAALLLKPNDEITYAARGQAFAMAGDDASALSDYNTALKMDPDWAFVYNCRAVLYTKQKKYDLAIGDYNAALAILPKHKNSFYGRGIVKKLQGDVAGGDADIAMAKAEGIDVVAERERYGICSPD